MNRDGTVVYELPDVIWPTEPDAASIVLKLRTIFDAVTKGEQSCHLGAYVCYKLPRLDLCWARYWGNGQEEPAVAATKPPA